MVWAPFCYSNADGDGAEGLHVLMNDFSAHTTSQVVQAIQQTGAEFNIIPAGYTGVLQGLDKGITSHSSSIPRKLMTLR